ncbi:MAG TPA: carboxypeptidase regulatory-like domain-containing protein [Bryobacteraceae bacterium]|nr:carboxypeptidase regulatory-like domain-containing protein [Bryobacteraceae bacterium]
MRGRCLGQYFWLCLILCLTEIAAAASECRGQVTFKGSPVPGATVTATQNGKNVATITDLQGVYVFPDLTDGTWTIDVQMFGFAHLARNITVAVTAPVEKWELKLLALDQIKAAIQRPTAPPVTSTASTANEPPQKKEQTPALQSPEDLSQRAADGFLINGSMNNGAASPFAQAPAFGNNRAGGRGLYTGGIGITFDNSAIDAKAFSLTGQNTPKPAYNRLTGLLTLGGPLQIPHVFKNGPFFFVGYQWTRNSNASTQTALVPDLTERGAVFSHSVLDPLTGAPFPGNTIPQNRISPQARALLSLYPLPNFANSSRYNYQIPILSPTHQDALQSRFNETLNAKNELFGRFAFQSTRTDTPNLFGFMDKTDTLGINTSVTWSHRFNQQWLFNVGYQFSRFANHVTPYFENRENVSGQAGITGNNQDPMNWGPPTLTFASGIAGLSDSQSSFNRNQTSGVSYSMLWNRGGHNVTFGTDFRRQEFNYLSQQDPRGSFTFTGALTGSDFADFLLGAPDTSSIAFGNADKYFRESVYDTYLNDDWRIAPGLTFNAGVRWEYGAPIAELYNRLVNLDIAPGFTAAAPLLATNPVGALTGQAYPNSLVRPDKRGFEPRLGLAWRPLSGSSMVVRAGYGVYYDTSVYQTIALQMAQQPPLSKTLSVQNSAANPLTLANGFTSSPSLTTNTFAIDPNFRVGYAQNWQVSVQRDLPGSLQMTATYLGIKGTRGVQEFLPNTVPQGAVTPCAACPSGFAYLTSNGNSTREAAQIRLRRRLHSGLAATLQYTFSRSIDDDAVLGGQGGSSGSQNTAGQNVFGSGNIVNTGAGSSSGSGPGSSAGSSNLAIAQNWLNLSAERGLSTFDQRHVLALQLQYTTGMGLGGGTLLNGWKGVLFKDWTFATQVLAGSGLPETPVYLAPVAGTGVTGTIRPDYTGAPLYANPPGLFLNPAAYTAPLAGQWGNAGRNSITGPFQLTVNASLGRTFRISDRLNLDLRVDSANPLNHPTFTAWNTTINSAQFGVPAATNAMRSMQTTLRLRF